MTFCAKWWKRYQQQPPHVICQLYFYVYIKFSTNKK